VSRNIRCGRNIRYVEALALVDRLGSVLVLDKSEFPIFGPEYPICIGRSVMSKLWVVVAGVFVGSESPICISECPIFPVQQAAVCSS
jgi:hypothetical protein